MAKRPAASPTSNPLRALAPSRDISPASREGAKALSDDKFSGLPEALFALADKIESRVGLATERVEKTTQAILAKAFRGELVPTEAELARQQNRDYEPATALLERIRAEQDNQSEISKPPRGSTRGKAKPPTKRQEEA